MPRDAELDHAETLRRLRGSNVVIIGDSLTRYQYLNLAYWLKTKKWRSPYPLNENEQNHMSWAAFFELTNQRLGGSETCDCYRPWWETGDDL